MPAAARSKTFPLVLISTSFADTSSELNIILFAITSRLNVLLSASVPNVSSSKVKSLPVTPIPISVSPPGKLTVTPKSLEAIAPFRKFKKTWLPPTATRFNVGVPVRSMSRKLSGMAPPPEFWPILPAPPVVRLITTLAAPALIKVASLPSSRIWPLFVVNVIVAAVPLPVALTLTTVMLPAPVVTIRTSSLAPVAALAAFVIVTAFASLILISPLVALSMSRKLTVVLIGVLPAISPTPVTASIVSTSAVIVLLVFASVIAPATAFNVTSPAVPPVEIVSTSILPVVEVMMMSLASLSVA